MLAAQFGTGQVFWSLLWFFVFVIWIYLLIFVFMDIFRSEDLGGWGKALWAIFIILVPYFGIFVYLIARGRGMSERQLKSVQAQQQAMDQYIRTTAGADSSAEQLAKLADLHTAGKLTDAEWETAKAKVLAG
jgi:hypothetical protein